jgi:tripartite-type tricarboxylate transporter receptor subunit TctC
LIKHKFLNAQAEIIVLGPLKKKESLMKRRAFVAGLTATAAITTFAASGSAYPNRPIKILQGYAPGGNADTIARVVGGEIAQVLGQSIVVEAQTGAGGTIAAASVARANPDGYTLLLAMGGHAVAGAIYNKLPYKTIEDFEMISMITYFPFLLVVQADSKFRTLNDVLTAARFNGQGIAYGTAGIGTGHHLAGELLGKLAGIQMLHVPYRGDAASVTALLGGEVPLIISPPTAVLANIKAGKLRAIGVTGPQRWAGMPELPTVAEQGVTGYDARSWAGFMAPSGTPRPTINRLNEETKKVLLLPSIRSRLEEMGGEVRASTPEEMKSMISTQLQRWTQLVAEVNIPKQ